MFDPKEFVDAFAAAALTRHDIESNHERIDHVGAPARYITFHPLNGEVCLFLLAHGDTIWIGRSLRLLVEPIDSVAFRPVDAVTKWVTQ